MAGREHLQADCCSLCRAALRRTGPHRLTDVDVEVAFVVGGELGEEVRQALEADYEAELAETEASNYRKVVADPKANGLSGADIAAILGIAPQRASQPAKLRPDEPRERNEALRAWARKRGLKAAGHERTVVRIGDMAAPLPRRVAGPARCRRDQ